MTRTAILGFVILAVLVGGPLVYRASLPAPDAFADWHERLAHDRLHGQMLGLQALCRSYRQTVMPGDLSATKEGSCL